MIDIVVFIGNKYDDNDDVVLAKRGDLYGWEGNCRPGRK